MRRRRRTAMEAGTPRATTSREIPGPVFPAGSDTAPVRLLHHRGPESPRRPQRDRTLTRSAADEDRPGKLEPFIESRLARMAALQGGARAGRGRTGQGAGTSLSGAKSA